MSYILIYGIEKPKKGHTITLTITSDGEVFVEYLDINDVYEEYIDSGKNPTAIFGEML